MDKDIQVISLDTNKVWYENTATKKIVHKTTSINEKENLLKASTFLTNKHIIMNGQNYSIQVPQIYSWNDDSNTLTMSFCSGENLELMLRDKKKRKLAIPFLQNMMNFILKEHFYWQDFAPRNIIISEDIVYLVDFEKPLTFKVDNILTFLRPHIFEEYSSFLLPNERVITTDQVFTPTSKDKNKKINIEDIKVKRIQSIAIALGHTDFITYEQYLKIQSMMIKAEEPFISKDEIVFPRVELVKMLEDKKTNPSVYIDYASTILKKNNMLVKQELNKEEERY